MILSILMSWGFVLSVVLYLYHFRSLVNKIKIEQGDFWSEFGSPDISNPTGQMMTISLLLFGYGCPRDIFSTYRSQFLLVRITFAINLFCFLVLVYLIYSGAFDV